MDDMEVVSALRAALADKVGRDRFELWFGAKTRLQLDGGILTIGTPNQFLEDWLRRHFRPHIESACRETLGICPELRFSMQSTETAAAETCLDGGDSVATVTVPPRSTPFAVATAEESEPAPLPRRRFNDLESFVNGPSNRLARAAAQMIIDRPGELSPLVIHGPTGVGKTHLLEGIWTAFRRQGRGLAAVYLSAEQFTSGFLQALRGSGLPSFRQKYRSVECLILDDLQFLCGKRCTQVELLYTMNTLLREGRQLVLAADRPLGELADLGPEMISRLKGGMVCPIERPDHGMRMGILARMAARFEMDLPPDVQRYVASRFTGNARELSGALCRLQATSTALRQPIDLSLAEQSLAEMVRHSNRLVRLPDIEAAICTTFGLEPQSLQSDRKSKHVSQPRMLAMWLARKYTRSALSEIGHYFGRRSHSTVISAQRRVDSWLAQGDVLELSHRAWRVDEVIRQIEQNLLAG